MVKSTILYTGDLRCEAQHEPSKTKMVTDAPVDNQGKGESFSPTDLVGVALGSCILTTLAIVTARDQISFTHASAEVTKEMVATPRRRIGRLAVTLRLPAGIPHDYRKKLEHIAYTCPVHQSISSEIDMPIEFIYPD
jgi:putative redox protein